MQGRVLDVGGKKVSKRGTFDPATTPATSWEYLNIDESSQPDIVAPAEDMGVPDGSYDAVMLAEVLQHLENAPTALREIERVLKPGGVVVATMPFLFPVHWDPEDWGRWSPAKHRREFGAAGLEVELVEPMGSLPAVLFDLCWVAWSGWISRLPVPLQRLAGLPFVAIKPLFAFADARMKRTRERINTGYLVVARKPSATS
jgi:SAM-dependent methyltransferase